MNTGIHDAANLGWKLAHVLQGRGDAELLLDSYEAERRPAARDIVEESTQRQHLAFSTGTVTRLLKDAALMIVGKLPSMQRMLQVQLSQTAVVYRDGPLVGLGGPPRRPGRTDVGARALEVQWHEVGKRHDPIALAVSFQPRHSLLIFEDQSGTIDVGRLVDGTAHQVDVLRLRCGRRSGPTRPPALRNARARLGVDPAGPGGCGAR